MRQILSRNCMRRKIRKNTGLIGLGIIGERAAAGLRAAGHQVYVWNRTPKSVPNFMASPAEVAEACDTIQLFVADSRAVMEVLEALAPKLTPEHVIICSATIGPEATLEAAKYVEERGARFLDAPFTGSKVAAERRELVYYVGGDDATFLLVKPVLEATSRAIVRAGGIGDAALIKVVTNQIAAVNIQVLSEALAIVKKAGLSMEALAAALEHHGSRSALTEMKLSKMIAGDYEPHFSLKHMFKDVQLGIQLANALDLDTPATAVTAGVMFGAMKRGWAEQDFASIFRIYSSEPDAAGSTPDEAPAALHEPAPGDNNAPASATSDPATEAKRAAEKPSEEMSGDENPADKKSGDAKSADEIQGEAKTPGTTPVGEKSAETKTAGAAFSDAQPAEEKSPEEKTGDEKATASGETPASPSMSASSDTPARSASPATPVVSGDAPAQSESPSPSPGAENDAPKST